MTYPHNLSTRRRSRSLDWESMTRLVWHELRGNTKSYTAEQFVELVGLKLAVVGAEFTGGDTARNVVARGDGRFWRWDGVTERWRVVGMSLENGS